MQLKNNLVRLALAGGIAAGSIFGHMPHAYADRIYYTSVSEVKKSKTPTYINYNSVSQNSKYIKKIKDDKITDSDPKYYSYLNGAKTNIYAAVKQIAKGKGYDIVVEKGDPTIKDYKDISSEVIKKLQELEKDIKF